MSLLDGICPFMLEYVPSYQNLFPLFGICSFSFGILSILDGIYLFMLEYVSTVCTFWKILEYAPPCWIISLPVAMCHPMLQVGGGLAHGTSDIISAQLQIRAALRCF